MKNKTYGLHEQSLRYLLGHIYRTISVRLVMINVYTNA